MDFKSQVVLKETCAGRVMILGVNDGTRALIDALRQLDRVHEIRVVDPKWDSVKQFRGLDKVSLTTEEIDDAIKPPVEEFDLVVVSCLTDSLGAFVESAVPIVFSLVNRGWVERGERVMIEDLTMYQAQLAEKIFGSLERVAEDAGFLEHACEEKTNNEVKLLIRPFFQAMRRTGEIGGTYDLDTWVEAFTSVAFFPGGTARFDDFVGAQ